MIMFITVANSQVISSLCLRLQIYRRELASFAYAASPAWIVQILQPIPILFINHFANTIVVFPLTGFPFDLFIFIFFLAFFGNVCGFYCAMLLASIVKNEALAYAIFPLIFMFLAIFAGFVISIKDVPVIWIWMPYISFGRWLFEGFVVKLWSRYDGGDEVIDSLGFSGFDPNNSYVIVFFEAFILSILIYISLRPPKSRLMYEDIANVPQKQAISTHSQPISPTATNPMHESLLITSDHLIINENESFGFQSSTTYNADWYKMSTGEVKTSRGCRLLFRNVCYSVPDKSKNSIFKKEKHEIKILKDVSGRILPGEMCALMGGSGCGKSTLLDVIAGRKTQGTITGDILFDGTERNATVMRASAYVMQDNVHYPTLTVRETLGYAAYLRLRQKTDAKIKAKRVQKVIDMLGLSDHSETIIGNSSIGGLSGGQMKRLSIGVEIINLPGLIFLDEPTTGLDSVIAYDVMSAVRNLANQNRTVWC
jgi:ABC-type lipoprotein export system ATPase subunit